MVSKQNHLQILTRIIIRLRQVVNKVECPKKVPIFCEYQNHRKHNFSIVESTDNIRNIITFLSAMGDSPANSQGSSSEPNWTPTELSPIEKFNANMIKCRTNIFAMKTYVLQILTD